MASGISRSPCGYRGYALGLAAANAPLAEAMPVSFDASRRVRPSREELKWPRGSGNLLWSNRFQGGAGILSAEGRRLMASSPQPRCGRAMMGFAAALPTLRATSRYQVDFATSGGIPAGCGRQAPGCRHPGLAVSHCRQAAARSAGGAKVFWQRPARVRRRERARPAGDGRVGPTGGPRKAGSPTGARWARGGAAGRPGCRSRSTSARSRPGRAPCRRP
jgi:hypothetical protein